MAENQHPPIEEKIAAVEAVVNEFLNATAMPVLEDRQALTTFVERGQLELMALREGFDISGYRRLGVEHKNARGLFYGINPSDKMVQAYSIGYLSQKPEPALDVYGIWRQQNLPDKIEKT